MGIDEFEELKRKILMRGKRSGPGYVADDECKPLIWYDQCFEREIKPAGTVNCAKAQRVGATQNGLDVALVASNANTEDLIVAAGATITFKFLQGDDENGRPGAVFEEVGPSICVKAPDAGMTIGQDCLVVKVCPGNFKKPWLKLVLEFEGAITGGTVDAALLYAAR